MRGQQTWHDLARSLCITSHRVDVRNDWAISVYSCQDERSAVSRSRPQIRAVLLVNGKNRKRHISAERGRKEQKSITVFLNMSEEVTQPFMMDSEFILLSCIWPDSVIRVLQMAL